MEPIKRRNRAESERPKDGEKPKGAYALPDHVQEQLEASWEQAQKGRRDKLNDVLSRHFKPLSQVAREHPGIYQILGTLPVHWEAGKEQYVPNVLIDSQRRVLTLEHLLGSAKSRAIASDEIIQPGEDRPDSDEKRPKQSRRPYKAGARPVVTEQLLKADDVPKKYPHLSGYDLKRLFDRKGVKHGFDENGIYAFPRVVRIEGKTLSLDEFVKIFGPKA